MVRLPWNPSALQNGSPGQVIDRIESSSAFRAAVAEQAALSGRPVDEIRREAHSCLREMVAAEDRIATGAWSRLGDWLSRAYEIDTDRENLERLRALDQSRTLVFLPNHRSYLDPFVLSSVLDSAGFPPNYVLGGSNLSFFPLGPIGQRSGLVFIRRQFKDAPVYKAMLGVYLANLVAEGANLEWYIEGGRTRTGKLRPPRMGILSYLVDAFESAGADDVSFVPVSIIYDQQHEVGAIAAEESGGTKAPESVKWAFTYARAQSAKRGKVHLRFAEPFSLRAMLAETRAATGSEEARLVVPKVAFEVAHRINEATPITAPALATLVLLNDAGRALTEEQMRAGVLPLVEYVRARQLPLASGMYLDQVEVLRERTPSEGQQALATLEREGVVTKYAKGTEPVYRISPDRYLEAAFYRNTLSHFFVTRAIVELALVAAAESEPDDLEKAVWEEALALRDLLKYDFFFSTKAQFSADVTAEMAIMEPRWEQIAKDMRADQVLPLMPSLPFRAAPRILEPFVDAYDVLGERLAARDPDRPVDSDALVAECLGIAQQRVLQRTLHSPESVSKDLFKNALQLAGNRGLLEPGTPDLAKRREQFSQELAAVVRRVDVLRAMEPHHGSGGGTAVPSPTTEGTQR
jgi:glycerol-3-phosphate O-acyltransferase